MRWPRRSRLCLARALHQRAGAEALEDFDKQDFAAAGFHHLMANDLIATIVAALDEHGRLDPLDQIDRGVLLEYRDQIDCLQRGQHLRACALVLHRTSLALDAIHRRIAVKPDDQPVTRRPSRGQHLDMAGMQDVETAIGKADAQALLAPVLQMSIEIRLPQNDLLLSREERM